MARRYGNYAERPVGGQLILDENTRRVSSFAVSNAREL
jgi:hypothetical protein